MIEYINNMLSFFGHPVTRFLNDPHSKSVNSRAPTNNWGQQTTHQGWANVTHAGQGAGKEERGVKPLGLAALLSPATARRCTDIIMVHKLQRAGPGSLRSSAQRPSCPRARPPPQGLARLARQHHGWCVVSAALVGPRIPVYRVTALDQGGGGWRLIRWRRRDGRRRRGKEQDVLDTWFSSALFPSPPRAGRGRRVNTRPLTSRASTPPPCWGRVMTPVLLGGRMVMLGLKLTGKCPLRGGLLPGLWGPKEARYKGHS
ncbi:hypothetical protein GWK47_054161 [Chionoecetes opilio]|uniref:Uncharacterized protein n=1 Tax=Chionoecetes opilio TaxID=41210 RepID=A0A8J4Y5B1_CHIOP|nr:hypothetical protein GWK47_054161 [Chionoecetes opilio]